MIVFTDGSASPNPGPGGFAVIDAKTKQPVVLGRSKNTSNIKMEGQAIKAAIEKFGNVEIHTDSEFWINVLTKWAPGWKRNNWQKKKGPIKNLALVKSLYNLYSANNVELIWVHGHNGIELNELADEWANNAREHKTYEDLEILEIPAENS